MSDFATRDKRSSRQIRTDCFAVEKAPKKKKAVAEEEVVEEKKFKRKPFSRKK
jgi:hypothetical protein